MVELIATVGGFFLGQFTFSAMAQWIGAIYVELITQPPEVRRAHSILALLFLHSGPWVLALLVFGIIMVIKMPASDWRPWLLGGFAASWMLMSGVLAASILKMRAQKDATHEG